MSVPGRTVGVPFKPGERIAGRQKGTPNKTTVTMKAAIMAVYDRLQKGHAEPHGHFAKWAEENSDKFYTHIAPKLIPVQVAGSDDPNDAPLGISVTFVKPPQTAE